MNMEKPRMFRAKIFIKCGLCGKELVAVMKGNSFDIDRDLGNTEIMNHVIDHHFKGDLGTDDGTTRIDLVLYPMSSVTKLGKDVLGTLKALGREMLKRLEE